MENYSSKRLHTTSNQNLGVSESYNDSSYLDTELNYSSNNMSPGKKRKSILKNSNSNDISVDTTNKRKKSRVSFSSNIDEMFKSNLVNQSRKTSQMEVNLGNLSRLATLNKEKNKDTSEDDVRMVNLVDIKDNSVIHITQQVHSNYNIINNNVVSGERKIERQKTKSIIKTNGEVLNTPLTQKKKTINFNKEEMVKEYMLESGGNSPINRKSHTASKYSGRDTNRTASNKTSPLQINIFKFKQEPQEDNGKKKIKKLPTDLDSDQQYSHWKKEEYKQLLNDPNYFKLVYEKKVGVISGFSANTFQNVKGVMEDKINVGINLKLKKVGDQGTLVNVETKSNINFFSIFDGHGGDSVAEELRLNLRDYMMTDPDFIRDTEGSILRSFNKVEEKVLKKENEKSGSCAITVIIIDGVCYVANVGDSRAVLSQKLGDRINPLSVDHKPHLEEEKTRIMAKGGWVYLSERSSNNGDIVHGVYRANPGRLAVSRSVGDREAKEEAYGGKPGAIIAIPDIIAFEIKEEFDFIVIGSKIIFYLFLGDGLFDKLPNKDVTIIVLETVINCIKSNCTYNQMLVKVTNSIIVEAIDRESKDNISCIFICFPNLYKAFTNKEVENLEQAVNRLRNNNLQFNNLYNDFLLKRYFTFTSNKYDNELNNSDNIVIVDDEEGTSNRGRRYIENGAQKDVSRNNTNLFRSQTNKTINQSSITVKDSHNNINGNNGGNTNKSPVKNPNKGCSCLCLLY